MVGEEIEKKGEISRNKDAIRSSSFFFAFPKLTKIVYLLYAMKIYNNLKLKMWENEEEKFG